MERKHSKKNTRALKIITALFLILALFTAVFPEHAIKVGDSYVQVHPIWIWKLGTEKFPYSDIESGKKTTVEVNHWWFIDIIKP